MADRIEEAKENVAQKIQEKGNENLADTIRNSDITELTNEDYISGLKSAYPEFKSELNSIRSSVEALQADQQAEGSHEQFYDEKNNKWMLRRIADEIENREDFKYISEDDTDRLLVYQDGIWVEKGRSKVRQHAMDITNELIRAQNLNQIYRIIQTRNEVYKENFTYPKNKIPFKNGVYDLEQEEFRDFKKTDNFTFKYDVDYTENPDNDKVDEFLHTIQDTEEKVRKLKEGTGLALLPDHPLDKALILYGQGSNGKNMYVKINQKILGQAAHKIDSKQLTGDKFAIGELEDKTFVFFDEFGQINDPDKLKTLIGDDQMRVRPFNDEGYLTDQRAFPVFAANEMPKAPEQNPGFFRRWEIVDFPFRFTSQENDGHKDKVPQKELEEEYMSDEALSAYASRCVEHLKNVLEREDFTNGQSSQETKHRWNKKSSPMYSFINNFIEQGELPSQSTTDSADYISKKKLLEMVNDYADMLNSTPVRSHELKAAMQSSPELELGNEGRIEKEDGSEERAYSGIRLTLPSFQDPQGSQDLYRFAKRHLKRFEDSRGISSAQMLVILESELELEACRYLETCNNDSTSLLELIKALDLAENEIGEVLECDFINVEHKSDLKTRFPQLVFDRESFNQAVKESDKLSGEVSDLKRPQDWLKERAESWSSETVKEIEDILEKAEEKGFGREAVENSLKNLKSNGYFYEPRPGQIKKL